MAHVTSPTRVTLTYALQAIPQALSRFASAFGRAAEAQAQGDSRLARVKALQVKSDAELRDLGLKRDDITRRVFRDHFYL